MEEEQKISNFINKRLEKFASFQDEEHLSSPRKGSFSSSQASSPRTFPNQHPPQKTSSTYQSSPQLYEIHEAPLVGYFAQNNSASMHDQFLDNQERFSKKGYGRSSSSVEEYYGKTQWRADMMKNPERNNMVFDTSKREYRRTVSGPGGVNESQKETGFRNSAPRVHNYGQTKMIDSPEGRKAMEMMQNLEINKAGELSRTQQNHGQRGWSGSPQRKEEMEIRRFCPAEHNYAQKEYIGSPKIGDERKMMQNLEANKVAGFSRGRGEYHQSQFKAPYMDAIEAARLHGGVLIFDYSKHKHK